MNAASASSGTNRPGASLLQDILDSLADVTSAPLRSIFLKSVALTLGVLLLAWFGLDALSLSLVTVSAAWLLAMLHWAIGLGLFFALALLAAPTVSVVAGFYLDDIAALIEAKTGRVGRAAPMLQSLVAGLIYAPLALLVSLLAIVLVFVPGFGLAAWIAANAYLLGHEYFGLCAMRFLDAAGARTLRREHRLAVFVYGLPIAAFVAVPLVNLATPLFATALMVRLVRRLAPT